MIDATKIKFGDAVYCVNEQNNAFLKKKIKTIIDGVEWYRYDRDHWEYSVSELIYCGKVTIIEEGDVDKDRDRQNQLHFKYPDGNIYYEYEADIGGIKDWFHTKEEAEAYAENMRKLKNND